MSAVGAGGAVTGIGVTNHGSGCIAPPPVISFSGGSPSTEASAVAIVEGGFQAGEIVVVPSRQVAVVVLIDSDTGNPAPKIALDIAHNLVFALP